MDAKLPAATWSMFTPRNNPGQAPVVPGQTVTDAMPSPAEHFGAAGNKVGTTSARNRARRLRPAHLCAALPAET